jgi:hypothetical protein
METLQVGKTYRDGCKYAYTISENTKGDKVRYPFRGTNERTGDSRTYTPYGVHVKSAPSIVDDLIIPYEPEQTTELAPELTKEEPKVKHLEVILAIVQGTPVQFKNMHTDGWVDLDERYANPVTNPLWDWRIKPEPEPKRTVQIGKRTVVAPEVEAPAVGSDYWVMYCDYIEEWNNDSTDFALLLEGRVFLNANDGKTCQEAIQALLSGKD